MSRTYFVAGGTAWRLLQARRCERELGTDRRNNQDSLSWDVHDTGLLSGDVFWQQTAGYYQEIFIYKFSSERTAAADKQGRCNIT